MSGINEIFAEDNILAYSKSCVDMARDMAELRANKFTFDTLMIPSRGAFPFFLGMTYSLKKLGSDFGEAYDRFYRGLAVPEMLAPLMPKNSDISTKLDTAGTRVLLIPFTADLNIPKFDSDADNDEYTRKTREYWARVTESFLKSTKNRSTNPYFGTFVDFVLKDIEKRQEVAETYEKFPAMGKFAMIDTVISGRASNDILRSFDALSYERYNRGVSEPDDVKPFPFLIVDDDGRKLKPKFKEYLRDKTEKGSAVMYQIPRIVSEDENASLLGVSAVTYPSIMRASRDFIYNDKEFFIGAGSWHINPGSDSMINFQKFMDLIYSGIDVVYDTEYLGREAEVERFREERGNFVEHARDIGILSLEDQNIALTDFLRNLPFSPRNVYETRSHVLHVPFDDKVTHEISANICNTYAPYGVHCKKKNPDTTVKKSTVVRKK